jgi:hypothetical protein
MENIMKTITLSLIALAALSGAAFANDSNEEERIEQRMLLSFSGGQSVAANALTAYPARVSAGLTEFEKMTIRANERMNENKDNR